VRPSAKGELQGPRLRIFGRPGEVTQWRPPDAPRRPLSAPPGPSQSPQRPPVQTPTGSRFPSTGLDISCRLRAIWPLRPRLLQIPFVIATSSAPVPASQHPGPRPFCRRRDPSPCPATTIKTSSGFARLFFRPLFPASNHAFQPLPIYWTSQLHPLSALFFSNSLQSSLTSSCCVNRVAHPESKPASP